MPRLLSGIVMVAAALGTVVAGGQVFALFWLAASVAIVWEWQRLIGAEGATSRFVLGGLALAVATAFAAAGLVVAAVGVLVLGMVTVAWAGRGRRLMAALGIAYAGALIISVLVLRTSFPGGLVAIVWLFAVVWGTDIMAYAGGRLFGGPKLAPRLSPSKTWSGFLIGIGCGALAGVAVAPLGTALPTMFLVGLAAGALAQGGDIFESSLKRRYGVKDASRLIPGHGGVMDRLDGFIVAALFAAILGAWHSGIDAAAAGLFNW